MHTYNHIFDAGLRIRVAFFQDPDPTFDENPESGSDLREEKTGSRSDHILKTGSGSDLILKTGIGSGSATLVYCMIYDLG